VTKTDGTGWIPVSFDSLSFGAPFSKLPTDPTNTTSSGLYYTYIPGGSWKLTALFESGDRAPEANKDGGVDSAVYEVGTSLTLAPFVRGLVGYWDFEETGTSATDRSGNGNTGSMYNGTTTDPLDLHTTASKVGSRAASFDGGNDFAKYVGNNTGLSGNASYSFSLWMKPTNVATDNQILLALVGANSGTGISASLFIPSVDGAVGFHTGGCGQNTANGVLSNNQWQHVVVTWRGGGTIGAGTKMYVNGVEKSTTNIYGNCTPNLAAVKIVMGAGWWDADANYPYAGSLDDVRIYNKTLSVTEVQSVYNATK